MTEPLVLCVDHWMAVDQHDDEQCHVCKLQAELEAARKEISLDNKIIDAADCVYHEQKAQITRLQAVLEEVEGWGRDANPQNKLAIRMGDVAREALAQAALEDGDE